MGDGRTWAQFREQWDRAKPSILARIDVLDQAAAAGASNEEARMVAHQLAGLLGSYEIDGATELAREAERLLDDAQLDGPALAVIAGQLRDRVSATG